jgi:hypothetical protein
LAISGAVLFAGLLGCGGGNGGGGGVGSVSVTSTPPGAAIWLDGRNTGQITPSVLINVAAGTHTLRLTLAGYQDCEQMVKVEAGKDTSASAALSPPPGPTGSLAVSSTPSGAAIWLHGEDTGQATPATLTAVPVGTHTLRLTLAGYQDYEQQVAVEAGQTTSVSAVLSPLPPPAGSIAVSSTPPGAAIWLDGQDTGQVTPATLTAVSVGTHTLRLTLAGYQDYEQQVEVEVGQTTSVSAVLSPLSPGHGSIAVSSTPPGAAVWLDGQDTGQVTPATLTAVSVGTHTVRLTLAGYLHWEDTSVAVAENQTTTIAATLARAIVIDGDFSDWANIPSMTDPVGDCDDRDDRYDPILNIDQPDVDVLEWKFTDQNGYLLVYTKVRGQIGRTVAGDWTDRYYFMVHLDVDNNLKTGFETYIPFPTPEEEPYTDWYYPSNLGSDYSFEFEFRSGQFTRTFITYWGPGNDVLGRWPYKGMVEFREGVPEMKCVGGEVEMRAPFSAYAGHVFRGAVMDVAISTESSSKVWGVGWCQDSTDVIDDYVVQSSP